MSWARRLPPSLTFALLLDARSAEHTYTPVPKFPAVARDIAVVCDLGVTVAALTDVIRRGGGKLLREVALFDIYTGRAGATGQKKCRVFA